MVVERGEGNIATLNMTINGFSGFCRRKSRKTPTLMLDGGSLLEGRRFKGTNTAFVPALLIKGFPRNPESQNIKIEFRSLSRT
jgi:hypothetical protein